MRKTWNNWMRLRRRKTMPARASHESKLRATVPPDSSKIFERALVEAPGRSAASRILRSSATVLTGALQVKFSQTYAAAFPSTGPIVFQFLELFREIILAIAAISQEHDCIGKIMPVHFIEEIRVSNPSRSSPR